MMPLWEQFTRPNTLGTTRTNTHADKREIDIGSMHRNDVKMAYYGMSMLAPRIDKNYLENTGTAESRAVGPAKVQKLDDEQEDGPKPDEMKVGRNRIHVDTEFVSKNEIKWLARKQSNIVNMQSKISKAQGQAMARFIDEAYFIQGIKAGMSTTTAYTGLSDAEKFYGGTNQPVGSSDDLGNSEKIRNAILDLVAKIEDKTEMVVAGSGDYELYVRPIVWNELFRMKEVHMKDMTYGDGFTYRKREGFVGDIKVVSCPWLPVQRNITNHHMSNASNSNAFDGDFTKVVGVLIGVDAIFDGWNIPVNARTWDKEGRHTTILETSCAFTVGIDDARHAGVLTIS